METENRKTIVITGGSDGIGAAAARALVGAGHRVILVGRNPEKTEKIAAELGCPYHLADYAKLSDVVRLASELGQYDRIDVLANNAGGAQKERSLTEDGFERTFQINLRRKKFWSESEQRFVTLRVSAKGIRDIEKNGLDACVKKAQEKGYVGIV